MTKWADHLPNTIEGRVEKLCLILPPHPKALLCLTTRLVGEIIVDTRLAAAVLLSVERDKRALAPEPIGLSAPFLSHKMC